MAFNAGDKLGPYEIVESIGKGGMGEVYRARDMRLGRDVAVKVSAQRFGERFEREARTISSLNHPNVCTLHDVGDNYLVMELVEGQTLSARIKDGPIPLEESLKIARQIAAALEAAHEKGIVHRDLKPGNVILKEDGTVKVLDFGLAKAGPGTMSGSSSDPEGSPTISMAATQAGVVLGTAAYMAPEQARGKPVDKRADIWSFGVVLYEMVTGQKLFAGEDLTETLAFVVTKQPDLSAAPPELQRLLGKCLQKDAKNRLRDIGDAWELLETKPAAEPASTGGLLQNKWVLPGAAVAAVAIALLAWWAGTNSAPEPPATQVVRTMHEIEGPFPGTARFAISPDGTKVAYPTNEGLRIWSIDSYESTLLAGTVGAGLPFFSPDGQQLGYTDGIPVGALRRISVNGGPSGIIVDNVNIPIGARWMENGEILYPSQGQGILTVPANGGDPTLLLEIGENMGYPQLLPGGNQILYGTSTGEILIQDLNDTEGSSRRTLASGNAPTGNAPTYLPGGPNGGYLVFWSGPPTSQALALALDSDYVPVGSPFPIINGIATGGMGPRMNLSESGTIAYQTGQGGGALGGVEGIRTLTWVDADGTETPLPAPPDNYRMARISPSGDRIAIQVGFQIWVWNVRTGTFARLPDFGQQMDFPTWTPDGTRILFRVTEGDEPGLHSIAADGTGEFEQVVALSGAGASFPSGFTPDGSALLIAMPGTNGLRPFAIPMGSDWIASGEPRLLRETELDVTEATVHPSGEWMAYTALVSNTEPALFMSPYPNVASQEIPVGTFAQPVWSRSGDKLYMANGAVGLAVADVDISDGLKLGTPEPLIPNNYYWGALGRSWDLAPDGRFLLMKNASAAPVSTGPVEPPTPTIRVVVNWMEEVKRLVPLP